MTSVTQLSEIFESEFRLVFAISLTFCQGRLCHSGQFVKLLFKLESHLVNILAAKDEVDFRSGVIQVVAIIFNSKGDLTINSIQNPPEASIAPSWLILLQSASLGSVVLMAGFLGWHSLTDLDIWFHLRMGKELLANGNWLTLNTYSFTQPEFPWLNHEWLFQIFAAWSGPETNQIGRAHV